jgi:hypothetical protein
MSAGQAKYGPQTSRGRVSIIHANVINGARCFSPVLPGEREEDWRAILDGVSARIGPVDKLEEEMVFNLAIALWQARRLSRYERAVTHKQLEEGATFHSHGDAMSLILERGVDALSTELHQSERVLGLLGSVVLAADEDPLDGADGYLILRLAVDLVLKEKPVEGAFSGLPQTGWTWRIIRDNLGQLCEASGKALPQLLKNLHVHLMEKIALLREVLEAGLRSIEAGYILENGETERLLLYHSRIQHRASKWLSMLAQSKADRLGLTITQPLENNGENGDGTLD